MVNVVLACCKNGGIGINNSLPWNIKDELQMFKIITNNSTIIMGYNTWYSLPKKPLLNRINVVLTRSKEKKEELLKNYDIIVLNCIEDALKKYKTEQCYYIGGASIYNYLIKKNRPKWDQDTHTSKSCQLLLQLQLPQLPQLLQLHQLHNHTFRTNTDFLMVSS